jgi:hypothetical protein
LEANRLWFQIHRLRKESVTICVTAVGLRLEIDVFEDGHVEYSRFTGNKDVKSDPAQLDAIINECGD